MPRATHIQSPVLIASGDLILPGAEYFLEEIMLAPRSEGSAELVRKDRAGGGPPRWEGQRE